MIQSPKQWMVCIEIQLTYEIFEFSFSLFSCHMAEERNDIFRYIEIAEFKLSVPSRLDLTLISIVCEPLVCKAVSTRCKVFSFLLIDEVVGTTELCHLKKNCCIVFGDKCVWFYHYATNLALSALLDHFPMSV